MEHKSHLAAMPSAEGAVSLLSNCTSGGCGAKIGPGELSSLLSQFPAVKDDRLLVGFDCSDDAAVYALDNKAIVSTVDFFSPMVEDPFIFGQIAAANALSDIFAMGAEPFLALNIVCFPEKLPKTILADILRGGAEKIAEAGAVLGGGHSIYDKEIKYGLAVNGLVEKNNIIRNNTPQIGHSLILTKPLGVGIIMAANRVEAASTAAVQDAIGSMRRLNRYAAEKMRGFTVSACTDVTGFGLLCHLTEMCGGTVSAELWPSALPYFSEAADYADEFLLTAAAQRNRNHFTGLMEASAENDPLKKVPFAIQELMFDPQSSGGLLICVDQEQSAQLLAAIQKDDPAARLIGRILPRQKETIIFKEEMK
jgi:selenide,water dikinase